MVNVSVAQLLSVIFCAWCSGFSSGLTGFGSAIIFQTLWSVLYLLSVDGTGDLEFAGKLLVLIDLVAIEV